MEKSMLGEKVFLRHKEDGEIMHFDERLSKHPKLEIVTEREAYPERFADPSVADRVNPPFRRGRARKQEDMPRVDLNIPDEVVTPPPVTPPELAADAARGFGPGILHPAANSISPSIAGLIGDN